MPGMMGGNEDALAEVMGAIKRYQQTHGVDLELVFKDAGGNRAGVITKPKFFSALSVGFHKLQLTPDIMATVARAYGTGPEDVRMGGFLEVRWRDFVTDVLAA